MISVISDEDLEHSIDEGFEDYEDAPFDQLPPLTVDCPMVENSSTVAPPLDSKSEDEEDESVEDDDEALDARGWLKLSDLCVTNTQARKIQSL